MKRPLSEDSTSNHTHTEQPPNKSKRMGSSLICPKKDVVVTLEEMNDQQVEPMEAVATGEGGYFDFF